jgi:hypothetical protein
MYYGFHRSAKKGGVLKTNKETRFSYLLYGGKGDRGHGREIKNIGKGSAPDG